MNLHMDNTIGAVRIECAALRDLYAAAPRELGARWLDRGALGAGIAPGLPDSAIVLNRAMGWGVSAATHADELAHLCEAYARAGVRRWFLHQWPGPDGDQTAHRLRAAGLQPARGWQSFAHDLQHLPAVSTGLTLRQIGSDQGGAFARIVCAGFDLGDAARPWLSALPGRTGWSVWMGFRGDEPVGVGALFVQDGVGWLDWAATDAAGRRQGCQTALLAARLHQARALGCRQVFTCTGEAVPGDPQHSYRNIERAGFRPTVRRGNWAPARLA